MISLKNISFFSNDAQQILKNITFDIPTAKITAIIGTSGSGKTTLLRIIAGLSEPTSGEIWINGQNITALPKAKQQQVRSKMAIVFQHGALFDSLTAWENVAFPLYEQGTMPLAKIRDEAERLLQMVDLHSAADLPIDKCSGGMQMRIAIARALAAQPEIILYDEPSSGLDPIARGLICNLIQHQQVQQRMTLVLVTHQLSAAFQISNHFVFLYEGQIIFEGSADELMETADPYIQRFIQPPSRSYRTTDLVHS